MLHADRQISCKLWGQAVATVVLALALALAVVAAAMVGLVSNQRGHLLSSQHQWSVRQRLYGATARINPNSGDTAHSTARNSSTVTSVSSRIRKAGQPTTEAGLSSSKDTEAIGNATERAVSTVKDLSFIEVNPAVSTIRPSGPAAVIPGKHGRQQQQVSERKQQQQQNQQEKQQQQQQQKQQKDLLTTGVGSGGRSAQALASGGIGRQAYVTLLYGEDFLLGVRVLGQSLRETGTTRELVVLCAGKLSASGEDTLVNEGWSVHHVDVVQNPGRWDTGGNDATAPFPPRFWAVYTKLAIFNMLQYSKVIFLDADTVVVRNMDEAFRCPGFCAVMRHSERLNSGVLVVAPSQPTFRDMLSKIQQLPSYTGGDQGFLNSYFYGFSSAPEFDPQRDYSGSGISMARLPTRYNADLGLYVINGNRWMLPADDIRVIHFTLGIGKPWHWWSSWLVVDLAPVWCAFRERLPRTPAGTDSGDEAGHAAMRALLFPLPLLLTLLLLYRLWLRHSRRAGRSSQQHGHLQRSPSMAPHAAMLPRYFPAWSLAAGYSSFAVAAAVTLMIIPSDMRPQYGWPLAYEWLSFLMCTLLAGWHKVCFEWGRGAFATTTAGRRSASATPPGHSFRRDPWRRTVLAYIVGCILLCNACWLPDYVGVGGLAARVVLSMLGALISAVFWTAILPPLSATWFLAGRAEGMGL